MAQDQAWAPFEGGGQAEEMGGDLGASTTRMLGCVGTQGIARNENVQEVLSSASGSFGPNDSSYAIQEFDARRSTGESTLMLPTPRGRLAVWSR